MLLPVLSQCLVGGFSFRVLFGTPARPKYHSTGRSAACRPRRKRYGECGSGEDRWQPLPGIENEDTEDAFLCAWFTTGKPMITENLKPRAKRLRAAIADVLNVAVTHSQSLELVAKEENYPNWDAACACFAKQTSSTRISSCDILVGVERDQVPSVASIFGPDEAVPLELSRLLDLTDERGALVLIAAATWQGKTTTANLVMSEFAPRTEDQPFKAGSHPRFKLIDDVRDGEAAFQAVALALAGVKVVATIHALQGVERLRVLLGQHRVGESLLDRLLEDGQVLSIQQKLVWSDQDHRQQSLQTRQQFAAAIRAFIHQVPESTVKQ